ncbi:MAG: hypothetical protein J4F46_09915, partial [Dehalococcoidia bacterium]|nr:hypothetical protein [Dehalococcoidia bacterium]
VAVGGMAVGNPVGVSVASSPSQATIISRENIDSNMRPNPVGIALIGLRRILFQLGVLINQPP